MTLKVKIIAGYLIITLITIIVAIVTIQNYTKVINLYEETTSRYHDITRITQELAYRMLQRQSSLNGFLLTGKTRHLVSYDENILPVKTLIRQASEVNPTDKDFNSVIAKYEKLIQEWEDKIAEEEKKMRQQLDYGLIGYQQYTASIAEMDREGRTILREFKLVEEKLISIIEKDLLAKSELAAKSARSTRNLLITVAAMSVLGSLVFGLFLSKHITSAIDSVVQAAGVIASGDLAHRIPSRRTKDELNLLASSFNRMAEQLEGKIKELTESEKKYSTVVENANDGIVIFEDQQFVFANKAFCKIIGYSLEELMGMDYLSIASRESEDLLRERHIKRLQGEEVPGITEGEFISKNGDTRYLEVNAGLIDYSNQKAVLVIFRDITERKEYEISLKRLSEKVFTAQEKERKRISQELHDEVGQALSVMNISVELLQRNDSMFLTDQQKRLEDLKKLIEKTLDDIHRISYNLRPYLLDNFGLVSALRWYTQDYSEQTGIEIGLQIEGEWGELPRALETVIYRVIQEALTNVSKHAEANRVFISVSYYPASIEIEIEDNGKGFEVEKDLRRGMLIKGGLGLFGIKERVSALGGVFSITSKKGSGTRLSIQIPTQYVIVKDNQDDGQNHDTSC